MSNSEDNAQIQNFYGEQSDDYNLWRGMAEISPNGKASGPSLEKKLKKT